MDEERPSAYLETTIPSYLVAKPSRDVITASHQQITHEWWATAKERFLLVVSAYVVAEIEAGATEYAERRLATIADLDVLDVSDCPGSA